MIESRKAGSAGSGSDSGSGSGSGSFVGLLRYEGSLVGLDTGSGAGGGLARILRPKESLKATTVLIMC